jgi:hypothetical protein
MHVLLCYTTTEAGASGDSSSDSGQRELLSLAQHVHQVLSLL